MNLFQLINYIVDSFYNTRLRATKLLKINFVSKAIRNTCIIYLFRYALRYLDV